MKSVIVCSPVMSPHKTNMSLFNWNENAKKGQGGKLKDKQNAGQDNSEWMIEPC